MKKVEETILQIMASNKMRCNRKEIQQWERLA